MKKITKIEKTVNTKYVCENCGEEFFNKYNISKCPICGKDICYHCGETIYVLSDKPLEVFDMELLNTSSCQELYICKDCIPKQMEKLEDRYEKELRKFVKEFNKQVKQLNVEYKEAIKLGKFPPKRKKDNK